MILECLKAFVLSVTENLIYYNVSKYTTNLTTKQKANVCSIRSSAIMFCAGIYYNYLYFFDFNSFSAESKFGRDVVIYFAGYLAVDTYLGYTEYPQYFGFLTGYIHHRFYIVVAAASIYYRVYNVLLMFMVSELPTFILSLGSYEESLRNDTAFGYTFLATRIIYHSTMVYHFWLVPMVPYIGPMTTIVHTYWFSIWVQKYLF
jgi:hypothetical protein